MNEFFQRLGKDPPQSQVDHRHQPVDASQGIRRIHAPPLLSNRNGLKARDDPQKMKLHLPNSRHRHSGGAQKEELTVTNLRKLYSSLLEEMAPLHHGGGTGSTSGIKSGKDANYRWKNSGTVTVNGSDDEGYDYSYTPDNSQRSWRLQPLPGVGVAASSKGSAAGGGGGGITGGDWSKDGIRRYYTGGTLSKGGGGGHSSNIISVGGIDVDVGTINGVVISPPTKSGKSSPIIEDDSQTDGFKLDAQFSIDDCSPEEEIQQQEETILFEAGEEPTKEDSNTLDVHRNRDVANSESSMEDIVLDADSNQGTSNSEELINPSPVDTNVQPNNNSNDNGSISFSPTSNTTMTHFESLYHLSPAMAWRLRSACSPKTPQELHLLDHGSEMLAQRGGAKADGIMAGLEVAKNCEARVCDGLARVGKLVSYCERKKGAALVETEENEELLEDRFGGFDCEEEDDDDLDAAEAIFAYFCEKNVLPMLIDSLLCHPPPLTSLDDAGPTSLSNQKNLHPNKASTATIGSEPSPFSGVCWTSAVKSQILSTIAMILFNTSSPLSLTYFLSNNYMNELIMGMLPLDQWKGDSLEEILPPYVTLLRGLVMRLRGEEGQMCLPLFLCQRPGRTRTQKSARDGDEAAATETYLPLLYAAVQVFCSPLGTSLRDSEGCLVRTTAMNVILNLCRITDPEVRLVLVQGGEEDEEGAAGGGFLPTTKSVPSAMGPQSSSMPSKALTMEQEMLFPHICNSLNSWFHRSVRLAMASLSLEGKKERNNDEAKVEAEARHKEIATMQFGELQYWLGFLDDLLSCEIRAWNARLVEWVLREVVVGTVLLRWNRALISRGKGGGNEAKVLLEMYRAKAEARVAVVFLTQLFGMVEYRPLIRLVGAVVLHQNYPRAWCGLDNNDGDAISFESKDGGSFVVTTAINTMIRNKADSTAGEEAAVASKSEEEADAGAGGGTPTVVAPDGARVETESIQEKPNSEKEASPPTSSPPSGRVSPIIDEMEHRALETVAKEHNFLQFAEDVELNYSGKQHSSKQQHTAVNKQKTPHHEYKRPQKYTPNKHRAALLEMLVGDDARAYSSDETILASMLLATILENDAIDDGALELFAVLPSPIDSIQLSPFETSIAQYLTRDWSSVDLNSRLSKAIECVSSLGMMLLERTIFHTWTEGGQCIDVVPFEHYYKSSKFIQGLGVSLSKFASQAQTHLHDLHATREIFSDLIRLRYSSTSVDGIDSPRSNDESMKIICSLQNYYPSNFIDNAGALVGELFHDGSSGECPSSGDIHLLRNGTEDATFSIRLTLHLRSLLACIQNLYQRFTLQNGPHLVSDSRWHGEGESLSFFTMEEADEPLLSIGSIGKSCLPEVGTSIDLSGRKSFRCLLPRKSILGRNAGFGIIIESEGTKFVVTPNTDLVMVVDPTEIYVAKATKEDPNRCTVIAAVPLRVIIASATEGEVLHIVCNATEKSIGPSNAILRNGALSLSFGHSFCVSAKECLDKHMQANETKIVTDMTDLLEKCSLKGPGNLESQSNKVEDSWCDFEHA